MSSPNLEIPHIAAAQNQKEVTANSAFDLLDLRITATSDIDVTAGGSFTVTLEVARQSMRIRLTGTPGAAFTVELPEVEGLYAIRNEADGVATIARAVGAETVDVAASAQALVFTGVEGVTGFS